MEPGLRHAAPTPTHLAQLSHPQPPPALPASSPRQPPAFLASSPGVSHRHFLFPAGRQPGPASREPKASALGLRAQPEDGASAPWGMPSSTDHPKSLSSPRTGANLRKPVPTLTIRLRRSLPINSTPLSTMEVESPDRELKARPCYRQTIRRVFRNLRRRSLQSKFCRHSHTESRI
jgi:hypothetical protein